EESGDPFLAGEPLEQKHVGSQRRGDPQGTIGLCEARRHWAPSAERGLRPQAETTGIASSSFFVSSRWYSKPPSAATATRIRSGLRPSTISVRSMRERSGSSVFVRMLSTFRAPLS